MEPPIVPNHVVITPCRNEADFISELIDSMVSQTILPSKWVIVLHNSTDSSVEIIESKCSNLKWIETIKVIDDSKRKRGAQIASLFNIGLKSCKNGWNFCSKIDADMILPENYFEQIFSEFHKSVKLGIASGSCFIHMDGKSRLEKVSVDHTRGGLKTYRKSCFDQIGGVREVNGWDGADNLIAQMNGWKTKNFVAIKVIHQRRTGSIDGPIRGCFEIGGFAHSMRYSPLFMVARSMHRMLSEPLILGGLAMYFGYLNSWMQRNPSSLKRKEILYLRKKQMARLIDALLLRSSD